MENKVKTFRGVKGWTQVDLANESGVSLSLIGMIEQGVDKGVSDNARVKISDAFGVEPGEVFPAMRFIGKEERLKHPHIKFEINRTEDMPTSFLEIDGQRIRFMSVEMKSVPGSMPIVTISVYARLLEGVIKGAKGELQIIHVDESTKGLIQEGDEIRRSGNGSAQDGKKEDDPPTITNHPIRTMAAPEDDGCPGR